MPFLSTMPVRDFDDTTGITWRVWSTVPSSVVVLTAGFEQGWLTFESSGRIRRLAPIPNGWETASAAELERLCALAQPPARRRPTDGDDVGSARQLGA